MITTLALDIEGTLISNAFSIITRPFLYYFLTECKKMFNRIVIYTVVKQSKIREISNILYFNNDVPYWFTELEYINWDNSTVKDLRLIPNCDINKVLLVDDCKDYIHKDQIDNWIPIKLFHHPYSNEDRELLNTLYQLQIRKGNNYV